MALSFTRQHRTISATVNGPVVSLAGTKIEVLASKPIPDRSERDDLPVSGHYDFPTANLFAGCRPPS